MDGQHQVRSADAFHLLGMLPLRSPLCLSLYQYHLWLLVGPNLRRLFIAAMFAAIFDPNLSRSFGRTWHSLGVR